MKTTKKLFLLAILLLAGTTVKAQEKAENLGYFNHLSAGLTLGTTGIGIDLAAPIGEFFEVRAGYSFFPLTIKSDVHYKRHNNDRTTEVAGKLNFGDAKLLLDYFPFKTSTFRLTAGFYLGNKDIVKFDNEDDPVKKGDFEKGEGLEVGDYIVEFDDYGIGRAAIQVNSFKPYVGIGIGRNIPRNTIGVSADFGVQFWGSPKVVSKQSTSYDVELHESDVSRKDGGAIKTISKISVFPVLTIRIGGKLF